MTDTAVRRPRPRKAQGMLDLPEEFETRYWLPADAPPGVDAFGPYAEAFWLPHLGPTAFVLARHILVEPGLATKAALAAGIGIVARGGPTCQLERSLARLGRFRLATVAKPETVGDRAVLYVRPNWPRLSLASVHRLPVALQEAEAEAFAREDG